MSTQKAAGSSAIAKIFSGRKVLGPLGVLGGILVMSAILRIVISADAVIAATLTESDPATHAEVPKQTSQDHDPASCVADTDLQRVLDALRDREALVETRESATETRIRELQELEIQIAARRAELMETQSALEATMALADSAAETDLAQLTAVYERMKAKDAAAHFEAMTPDFAAGFLGRMKPAAAADVMSNMTPEFAYAISVVLAGRNAQAGLVAQN